MDKNALDFARKLGRRVRELRERKGLTQDRAAELAGITGKYWGEVERGSVAVSAVVRPWPTPWIWNIARIVRNFWNSWSHT